MRKKKLVKDLIRRRDEVIKRARVIAQGKIPDWLLELQLPDTIKWIIDPLILRKYKEYKEIKDKDERTAIQTAYKIIERYDGTEENEKTEVSKDKKEV